MRGSHALPPSRRCRLGSEQLRQRRRRRGHGVARRPRARSSRSGRRPGPRAGRSPRSRPRRTAARRRPGSAAAPGAAPSSRLTVRALAPAEADPTAISGRRPAPRCSAPARPPTRSRSARGPTRKSLGSNACEGARAPLAGEAAPRPRSWPPWRPAPRSGRRRRAPRRTPRRRLPPRITSQTIVKRAWRALLGLGSLGQPRRPPRASARFSGVRSARPVGRASSGSSGASLGCGAKVEAVSSVRHLPGRDVAGDRDLLAGRVADHPLAADRLGEVEAAAADGSSAGQPLELAPLDVPAAEDLEGRSASSRGSARSPDQA